LFPQKPAACNLHLCKGVDTVERLEGVMHLRHGKSATAVTEVGATLHCGSCSTGNDRHLHLLPGDLRRQTEPLRLSDGSESLLCCPGKRSLQTLARELAMESKLDKKP
jgi:hypothetical protein